MSLHPSISLIPVIELQPANFNPRDRISPTKSYLEAPKEWLTYHQACYKDAGFEYLKPIEPLSWLFEIESLSEANLKIILKNWFEGHATNFDSIKEIFDDPIEYAPLVPGGYLCKVDGLIKSRPGCCCGLEDLVDWKEGDRVHTGHGPNDIVDIFRHTSAIIELVILEERFTIPEKDYTKIIKAAELNIEAFIQTSGDLLKELFHIKNSHEVARAMIYKWD